MILRSGQPKKNVIQLLQPGYYIIYKHEQRHDKVIVPHDNTRPDIAKVVKRYLETLK